MVDNETITFNFQGLFFYRGRVALYAILKALGIGPADEVAIQAFTCLAVPEGVMATGARPLWIDIEPNGFNMDAKDLDRKLTPNTKAIVVQHTYGIPAAMDEIEKVARAHNLPIIEDCCHTLASTYRGRRVGTFGVAAFYSFEWGKPVAVGIGGAAVINDDELRQRVANAYQHYTFPGFKRTLRIQLQYHAFRLLYRPSLYWPVRTLFHTLGNLGLAESNYNPVNTNGIAEDFRLRMAPVLQKRLHKKLQRLKSLNQHSQKISAYYQEHIQTGAVVHPPVPADAHVIFARYPLITHDKRKLLLEAQKANVEMADWYATPVHPLSGESLSLVHYAQGSCPNAEKRGREVITLPTHFNVREKDAERITNFLNNLR